MIRLPIAIATALLLLASAARAETIEMTVNGLMCDLCVQKIEKTLHENTATQDVVVSLEHKLVAVATKPGADIPDETLRTLIRDAGFDVKAITRTERTIQTIREELKTKT